MAGGPGHFAKRKESQKAANNLAEMAMQLRNLVAQFKIDDTVNPITQAWRP